MKAKITERMLTKVAHDSNLNQEIQMLLYGWRDRGCPYDVDMINMVFKIMKIARTSLPKTEKP